MSSIIGLAWEAIYCGEVTTDRSHLLSHLTHLSKRGDVCRMYNVYSVNHDIAHKGSLIRLSALVIMIIFLISYCDRYGGFRKKTMAVLENEDKKSQCPFTVVASNSEVLSRDDQYVLNRVYHTKTFNDGNHFLRRRNLR